MRLGGSKVRCRAIVEGISIMASNSARRGRVFISLGQWDKLGILFGNMIHIPTVFQVPIGAPKLDGQYDINNMMPNNNEIRYPVTTKVIFI